LAESAHVSELCVLQAHLLGQIPAFLSLLSDGLLVLELQKLSFLLEVGNDLAETFLQKINFSLQERNFL